MGARVPEGEPWVRVAAVLAEAAGVDESRPFDDQAVALAKTMRGVRHDWAGKPTITWTMAEELLISLKAESARKREQIEAALIEQDQRFRASLPAGVPAGAVPEGVTAAQLMMLSDPMGREGRRIGVAEDLLEGGEMIYRPVGLVEHSATGDARE